MKNQEQTQSSIWREYEAIFGAAEAASSLRDVGGLRRRMDDLDLHAVFADSEVIESLRALAYERLRAQEKRLSRKKASARSGRSGLAKREARPDWPLVTEERCAVLEHALRVLESSEIGRFGREWQSGTLKEFVITSAEELESALRELSRSVPTPKRSQDSRDTRDTRDSRRTMIRARAESILTRANSALGRSVEDGSSR